MTLVLWFKDRVIASWRLQQCEDTKFHVLDYCNEDFCNEDYCNLIFCIEVYKQFGWIMHSDTLWRVWRDSKNSPLDFCHLLLSKNINTDIYLYMRTYTYIRINTQPPCSTVEQVFGDLAFPAMFQFHFLSPQLSLLLFLLLSIHSR